MRFPASYVQFLHDDALGSIADAVLQEDPLGGRDVGWLAPARFAVRHASAPGDRVYDPFAGFGTTLLAAALEGRTGVGTELHPPRVAFARARLAEHAAATRVLEGDARFVSAAPQSMHLCVTNVPYVRAEAQPVLLGHESLYAASSLQDYLDRLRAVLVRTHWTLRRGAGAVFFAEDVPTAGATVPLVAYVTDLVAQIFDYQGQIAVLYPLRKRGGSPWVGRDHEVAIVAARRRPRVCEATAQVLLRDLAAEGHPFVVFGSYGEQLRAQTGSGPGASHEPADIDLLVPFRLPDLMRLCAALQRAGFELYSWQDRVCSEALDVAKLAGRSYLRAGRPRDELVVDLCYELPGADFEVRLERSLTCAGLRVLDVGA